jgi:hypothetical protein
LTPSTVWSNLIAERTFIVVQQTYFGTPLVNAPSARTRAAGCTETTPLTAFPFVDSLTPLSTACRLVRLSFRSAGTHRMGKSTFRQKGTLPDRFLERQEPAETLEMHTPHPVPCLTQLLQELAE